MLAIFPQDYDLDSKENDFLMSILFSVGVEYNRIHRFSSLKSFFNALDNISTQDPRMVIFTDTILLSSIISLTRRIKQTKNTPRIWIIFNNESNPVFMSLLRQYGKLLEAPPAIPVWIFERTNFLIISLNNNSRIAIQVITDRIEAQQKHSQHSIPVF